MDQKRMVQHRNRQRIRKLLAAITLPLSFGLVTPLHATPPTSGQLVIINGLANVVNGSVGNTASSIAISVSDSVGACFTATSVVYSGVATVKWDSSKTHSTTQCTGITTVNVTALKNSTGLVQYDSTANNAPPATATAPTAYTAPTTPITNLVLIVTGDGVPASDVVATGTVWGIGAAETPVYDTNNGAISVTGVMGGTGAKGLAAMQLMRHYAITPVTN